MKSVLLILFTIGVCLVGPGGAPAFQEAQPAPQQPCKTEEAIVSSIKQDVVDRVGTVKKESLDDFQKGYHQQACMSKLSICLQTVQELLSCLDKAVHDPATVKTDASTCKAKQAAYEKLKTALQQDLAALKSAKDAKAAKDAIEKFDFSH
jgi:hypothetical protein